MPTVLTIRNVRMAIYTNDHPPPHVHAIKPGGGRAKFELHCPEGPVRLVEQTGFGKSEIVEVGEVVATELTAVCGEWSRIHGRV